MGQPVSGEHLVPVVGDPAAAPPIPPTAAEAHRVGVGGPEERLGRWGAPVEQQPTTVAVGEAEPPDVCRLGILRGDDAPEAQVQPEPPEGTQACGQPVDLQVPVQRRLAAVRGCPACLIQAFRKVGDRLLEALGDGGEVPLVARDQGRVRLADEALGKVEGAGGQGTHVIGSSLERACGAMRPPVRGRAARSRGTSEDWAPSCPSREAGGARQRTHTRTPAPITGPGRDSAPRRGSCRKPPGGLYVGDRGGNGPRQPAPSVRTRSAVRPPAPRVVRGAPAAQRSSNRTRRPTGRSCSGKAIRPAATAQRATSTRKRPARTAGSCSASCRASSASTV